MTTTLQPASVRAGAGRAPTPRTWLVNAGDRRLALAVSDAVRAGGDRVMTTAAAPQAAADPAAAREAVAAAVRALGRLDVVVSTAPAAPPTALAAGSLAALEAHLAAAFWRPLHLARAALPVMRAQGAGRIVQAGVPGFAGVAAALAAEAAPFGVAVTSLPPGGRAVDALLRLVAGAGDLADAALAAAAGACRLRCENYAR